MKNQCENCPMYWWTQDYWGEFDEGCECNFDGWFYGKYKMICYMPKIIKKIYQKYLRWKDDMYWKRECMMMEDQYDLTIVYLSDNPVRIENSKKILMDMGKNNNTIATISGFFTNDAEYIFVDCSNHNNMYDVLGDVIKADQVIIDFREPMISIAKKMLKGSCVPEEYQIIDDRKIGTMDTPI